MLHKLGRKDAPRAGAILVEAFQGDLVWQAIFGASTLEQRRAAFEAPITYCTKFGEVWATSASLEGIAAWLPGRYADMTLWRMIRSGALLAGMRMGAQLGRKMEPVFRPIVADRKAHMKGRAYLHLQILGVAPAMQGQGLGGKLLRALISRSTQQALPIYLETETEENVSLYRHFGFRVAKRIILPVVGLPMWEMVREPGSLD